MRGVLGVWLALMLASAASAQEGQDAPTCVLIAADPELTSAELDSVWHRSQDAPFTHLCRLRNERRGWIADYLWESIPPRPGQLFDFGQLDSVYDFAHQNIKKLPSGGGPGTAPEIIPGLELDREVYTFDGAVHELDLEVYPFDGTVTPDGTIWLFVDRWANRFPMQVERFAVYCRPPGADRWQESEPFGEIPLGRSGPRSYVYRSVLIGATPQGDVYIFNRDGCAVAVGKDDRLLAAHERVTLDTNPVRIGRLPNVDPRRLLVRIGEPRFDKLIEPEGEHFSLGADIDGNAYSSTWHPEDGWSILKHDPRGILVAAALQPFRGQHRDLHGKGSTLVSPSGRILYFHVTTSALDVIALSYPTP